MEEPTNAEVADALDRYGTLLELSGESPFRVRAYHRAAESVRYLGESIAVISREKRLRQIPGIGEGIAAAIDDMLVTGTFGPLAELSRRVPIGLIDVLTLSGVGVKTAQRLYQELGVTDLESLEKAVGAGRLRGVRGLGPRVEATVVAGLESLARRTGRTPLGTAVLLARDLSHVVESALPRAAVHLAGSVRRYEETIGDIDIVVGHEDPAEAIAQLRRLPAVAGVLLEEADRLRVRLQNGIDADFFVAPLPRLGSTLVRATGSTGHLDLLGQVGDARSEHDVYARLGLPWIPPELRQGHDEVMRASEIVGLLKREDIRGEFHAHTTWSDGSSSIAEMALAAAANGYQFLGITDHSQGLGVANGLTPDRLAAQRREIEETNRTGTVRLFAGAEVEVARDGGLDFSDETLAGLDVVVASLHVGLRQPRPELTDRLVGVLTNRNVDIVAHPSGRLIERRDGGDFDWDRVFASAAAAGTALEINADPARLDLNHELARKALASGCLLTINCDAHRSSGFDSIEFGVAVARRAWARPEQILNAWPLDQVEEWLAGRNGEAMSTEGSA